MSVQEKFKKHGVELQNFGHEIQLAGAIYTGMGRNWIVVLPDESLDSSTVTTNLDSEEWIEFLRQTDLLEIEVTLPNGNKAIVRKSQRQVDQTVSWQVYRRDGFRCRYCGADKVPLTVDHLVLWEEGGPSTAENMVTACRKCNKTRGRTGYAQWLSSNYYHETSKALPFAIREDNEALVEMLDKVPRHAQARSR